MIIRKLTEAELPDLAYIDAEVNPSCWSLASYNAAFNHAHQFIWGIFNAQLQLLGGMVYSSVGDEAEILQLCIAHDWQQQGLAQHLFEYILSNSLQLQQVRQVFLEVRENNIPAIQLYTKLGFNLIAQRKDYYRIQGKYYTALIMAKTLRL